MAQDVRPPNTSTSPPTDPIHPEVAREVIDALLATNNHEITILSRHSPPSPSTNPNLHWRTVDYTSPTTLTSALTGIHTVLSFIQPLSDPSATSQIALIDACIAARVIRFAPSEYASASTTSLPFWQPKALVRSYLLSLNTPSPVLEYTLFQPGLLLDYLATPYQTSRHITPLSTPFDLQHRRAVVVAGHLDAVLTLTSAADVAKAVEMMVSYSGRWPPVSGIRGNRVTFAEVLRTAEKIRGEFTVAEGQLEDLQRGELKLDWGLERTHEAVGEGEAEEFKKGVMVGILLGCYLGAWDVSGEVNELFPEYEFEGIEKFLKRVWEGKP